MKVFYYIIISLLFIACKESDAKTDKIKRLTTESEKKQDTHQLKLIDVA